MPNTDPVVDVLREISRDPGVAWASAELSRVVAAWVERHRRRTEMVPALHHLGARDPTRLLRFPS